MSDPSRPAKRSPDGLLLLIAGVTVTYVLVNGMMFWVASQSPPALVSGDYYEASKRYGAVQAERQATVLAGWRVEGAAPQRDRLTVRILDKSGRPASGFSGEARAYRPNDTALDQVLTWSEDAANPGLYHAHFGRAARGQWVLHLALRRGGERIVEETRVVTP